MIMFGNQYTTAYCGDVIVCEYINRDNVTVVFVDTGTLLKTTKDRLTKSERPRLRDPMARTVFKVGRIGVGRHKAHVKGADTLVFGRWRAMLRRCYYRSPANMRTWYDGVTVCDEWHNFQTFADWFEDNYPRDGKAYELDKDSVDPTARQYSPATCRFISQSENLSLRRSRSVAAS